MVICAIDTVEYFADQSKIFTSLIHNLSRRSFDLDIDSVHKLRVCIRRLRAALWVLHHDYCYQTSRRLRRNLRNFGRVLGHRRQLDVAFEMARKYSINPAPLRQLRRESGKNISDFLSKEGDTMLRQVVKMSNLLIKCPPQQSDKTSTHKLKRHLRKWQFSLPNTKKRLHQMRIFVKKVRYIFEARHQESHRILKTFQNDLGFLHDVETLSKLLTTTKRVDLAKKKSKKSVLKTHREVMIYIAKHL